MWYLYGNLFFSVLVWSRIIVWLYRIHILNILEMIFWIKFTPFFPHPSYIRAMCVHVHYLYALYIYVHAMYIHTHDVYIYWDQILLLLHLYSISLLISNLNVTSIYFSTLICKFGPGHGSGTVPAGLPQGETEGFYIWINRLVRTLNVLNTVG